MPLRPIDAIFVHPERRLYVVYYRGELWELPRMKIDDTSWQRRQPFIGASDSLHLSSHQNIKDPVLAQKLRTLNLPQAVRGVTLPRFEAWWEVHGYEWLKEKLTAGVSPLAAHSEVAPISSKNNDAVSTPESKINSTASRDNNATSIPPVKSNLTKPGNVVKKETTDIFADMLAELADEVLNK